jgi:hypothetical protein
LWLLIGGLIVFCIWQSILIDRTWATTAGRLSAIESPVTGQ